MELLKAIYGRRAVRSYGKAAVGRDKIERVIDAAVHAPSAMNQQLWTFAIIQGAERMTNVAGAAKRHLLATMEAGSALAKYRDMLMDPGFSIFYGAPCLIVVCATSRDPQAREDCCLAAQNLMLAAHGEGLGTCWIGFARPWLDLVESRRMLGIPSDWVAVAPIVIGVPVEAPAPTPRRTSTVVWCDE
jgi:nitroreductase